ncbi:MAG TPA: response regulator [Candidatus Omnitrophota bacterium]|nr:response regulator [Candidatus Omnitrophota bacterium]HPB67602.1 response regulator [Candidatus Omnitrophota bacterium]HQO57879.1 response regulator [Candidatus Omnitrophota bacterium]HQP11483.1 response regulator [Candidatus Omnitrophota bacterium]
MSLEKKIKVLVVDDEEDFLDPISYYLGTKGYQIATAMSGAEALGSIDKEDFDVVFLDVNMQPMDGFECLFEIKKRKPALPVIMLTAQNSSIREGKSKIFGAEGFLEKSLDYSQAVSLIERILTDKNKEGV